MKNRYEQQDSGFSVRHHFRFLLLSALGAILFFVPISINGVRSIMLDHLVSFITQAAPRLAEFFVLCLTAIGGLWPWANRSFAKDYLNLALSVFRILAIPLGCMAFWNVGPSWLMEPNMLPFVWKNIAVAVTLIVPVGAVLLTFITGYGLLEFIGVLVRPLMRPVFHVPGRAAVDAVASFVGSFSVAMFLTNKLYKESKYTYKEAAIIMTGFSTISVAFMIVIAKTARLMELWNFYFWSAFAVTSIVTALTVRLYPLSKCEDTYYDGVGKPEVPMKGNIVKNAYAAGVKTAATSPPLLRGLWDNLRSGLDMCLVLTPTITSMNILALTLARNTSVFDLLGFLYYPIAYLLSLFGLPEPAAVGKATAVVLGDVFVANVVAVSLTDLSRYIVAVASVSTIVFFAGYIPCLYSTSIRLKPWHLLLIWFERAALSIILAGIVGLVYF